LNHRHRLKADACLSFAWRRTTRRPASEVGRCVEGKAGSIGWRVIEIRHRRTYPSAVTLRRATRLNCDVSALFLRWINSGHYPAAILLKRTGRHDLNCSSPQIHATIFDTTIQINCSKHWRSCGNNRFHVQPSKRGGPLKHRRVLGGRTSERSHRFGFRLASEST
jgi:hypothetical protein